MRRTIFYVLVLLLPHLLFTNFSLSTIVPGDINGDSVVDSLDVIKLANFLAGNVQAGTKEKSKQND